MEQRDALNGVIRQLKQDATGTRNKQSPGTVGRIPPQHSNESDSSSLKAEARDLPGMREDDAHTTIQSEQHRSPNRRGTDASGHTGSVQ